MGIRWFIGLVDGVPAGFAAVCPLPVAAGGNGAAMVHVLPGYRRRGLGSALRRVVEDVARGDQRPGLTYSYVEGERGQRVSRRARGVCRWSVATKESVLDPGAADRAHYSAKAIVPGVEIAELPVGDMDDLAWLSLHEFVQARLRETPDSADRGEATCPTSRFARWWTSRGCS